MKKLGLLVIPLMTVSFLASCGGNKPTEYVTHKFTFHGTNCKINGVSEYSHDIYENDKNVQYTITPNMGFKLPETIDSNIPYDNKTGVITISEIKTDIELSVVANPGPTPGTTYTLTFNCTNCKALDENKKEITSVQITASEPYTTYNKFYLDGKELYKKPLESLIKVEKTNKNEEVDFEYNPLTGEIEIPIIDNLTVTASGINKTLEECNWDEINEISTTGRAKEFFYIGEEKEVKLIENNVEQTFSHKVRIIGFNHDYSELPDEGDPVPSKVLGITFEFENVITKGVDVPTDAYTTIWDGVYKTSGYNYDYRESVINNALNNKTDGVDSVINRLPNELKEVIKPVDKKVGVSTDEGQNYIATSFDGETHSYPYLFLLAHDEITKHEELVTENEGTRYQYYEEHTDQNDRIKRKVGIESGNGEDYWLRSPDAGYSSYAWRVSTGGYLYSDHYVYYVAFAVAPAFCI